MPIPKWKMGSATTLLSTGLNSLANNSLALSAAFDNTQGQTGDGYLLCDVELTVTFGTAPTANSNCSVWLLAALDGTNYETGGASTTPARMPDVVFPLAAVTTQQIYTRRAFLPWGLFKALLKNDGTGQAFPASGSTLKIKPVTPESV